VSGIGIAAITKREKNSPDPLMQLTFDARGGSLFRAAERQGPADSQGLRIFIQVSGLAGSMGW
jgi:hypothetical protein